MPVSTSVRCSTMAKKLIITVHSMDGKTDVYDDVSNYHQADGVMTITRWRRWMNGTPEKKWHLSMANIRTFDIEWQKR